MINGSLYEVELLNGKATSFGVIGAHVTDLAAKFEPDPASAPEFWRVEGNCTAGDRQPSCSRYRDRDG